MILVNVILIILIDFLKFLSPSRFTVGVNNQSINFVFHKYVSVHYFLNKNWYFKMSYLVSGTQEVHFFTLQGLSEN
jgi:hypothetical protein